jgi:hypothetical protein
VAHTHADQDETFYLISGELEFLDGDTTFVAGPGDLVYCPRTIRHRFKNVGLHTAKMLFFYTPGGSEGLFLEGGSAEAGRPGARMGPERFQGPLLISLRSTGWRRCPNSDASCKSVG